MKDINNNSGYTHDGTPCDFSDGKIKWIYRGKGIDGSDKWSGIPLED